MDTLERINELPEELLIQILALLEPSELHQAGGVCRRWRRIVLDDSNWRRAFECVFTRRPFERLLPNRMPTSRAGQSWVGSSRSHTSSWRYEYIQRLRLCRQWKDVGGGDGQKRLEYNVRASSVDRVIVSERYGWALAVSMAGRAAVRSMPKTGKVFARDNDTHDIVFAMPKLGEQGHVGNQEGRVCSLSTRIDRIVWGYDDGRMSVTHLTKYGTMHKRVVAVDSHMGPVFDTAGPLDQLAQQHEWRAAYEGSGDDYMIASAGADGSVRLWSDESGETLHVLRGVFGAPLVRVTWAEGSRYVVAASSVGAIFVWDLASAGGEQPSSSGSDANTEPENTPARFENVPWLTPAADEYAEGRIQPSFVFPIPGATGGETHSVVQLTGDPYSDMFIVATESGGVLRMSADGRVHATFTPGNQQQAGAAPRFTAAVTAARWKVDDGGRHVPGFSRAPSRSHSELSLDTAGTRKGKAAATETGSSVLRLNLSKIGTSSAHFSKSEVDTRLLLVGDAVGNLWMFDADAVGTVHPLRSWPRLHRYAVSALSINACTVVSAARDGQVFVIDPVSSQLLRVLRCRGGGRGDRRNRRRRDHNHGADHQADAQEGRGPRRLDPWFWSIHPAIMNAETRNDIFLAQILASRTSEQWGRQVLDTPADALDRFGGFDDAPEFYRRSQVEPRVAHGFPTLVADVASSYGWLVIANGTRIQTCFVNSQPSLSHSHSNASPALRSHLTGGQAEDREREMQEDMEDMKLESMRERERRIADHDRRMYYEREFAAPSSELGLDQDEQLAYALWLSSQHDQQSHQQGGGDRDSCGVGGAAGGYPCPATSAHSGDRQSQEQDFEQTPSATGGSTMPSEFALEGMTEEEQLEYALFLSRSASEAAVANTDDASRSPPS
ncbi:hypothetical protein GQ54DRAFT_295152 [Martensiomyces pterosporus]|nr:hypothetical protein GQ54DRAFT_295152 [Martensiomyces pterosporus]